MHAVKPAKTEIEYLSTLKKHPGQKVWQLDLETMQITEAVYDKGDVNYLRAKSGDMSARHKLIIKDNHLYCCAISAKVADKKFIKMLFEYAGSRK